MSSFPKGMRVALFGANGGIGSALLRRLDESERVGEIFAFGRTSAPPSGTKTVSGLFDLTDERSIAAAAERCRAGGALHLVFVATGVLHSGLLQPEKTWRSLSADQLAANFATNAIGPALIAKHFLDQLSKQDKSVFAVLSARVGSIEDNRLGGWHGYRASKAALHQLIRTCAIELARRNPTALCVALHPGTVNTRLSKPFQANVAHDKLFTPDYSARRLLTVVDRLEARESGNAYAWDGGRIPF